MHDEWAALDPAMWPIAVDAQIIQKAMASVQAWTKDDTVGLEEVTLEDWLEIKQKQVVAGKLRNNEALQLAAPKVDAPWVAAIILIRLAYEQKIECTKNQMPDLLFRVVEPVCEILHTVFRILMPQKPCNAYSMGQIHNFILLLNKQHGYTP